MPTIGGRPPGSGSSPSRTRANKPLCPNFSEVLKEAREKRASRKSDGRQSWIVRKLAIGFVVGIVGYAYYVYVVTFCIPMVQQHRNALGNRRIGIAFLVTFNVLFLMFVWTYAKIVFTSPGYALKYTQPTPPPVPQNPEPFPIAENNINTDDTNDTNDGSAADSSLRAFHGDDGSNESHHLADNGGGGSRRESANNINMSEARQYSRPSMGQHHRPTGPTLGPGSGPGSDPDPQTTPADALPPIAVGRAAREQQRGEGEEGEEEEGRNPRMREARDVEQGLPPPFYSRRPPTHPILSPEFRYCPRDGIVKPMRTHHCRACGTCVLKYDHHCPWIGQCVGAYNQKFFINFLQWSSVFTLFIFISVLVMYARLGTLNPEPAVNAQHFVILGLSFFFTIFPVLLLMTQIYLVSYNMTTVEHLHLQRMQEREKGVLGEMTGFGRPLSCSGSGSGSAPPSSRLGRRRHHRADIPNFKRPRWPWQAILLRNEIRRRWDQEWGKLGTEGNLWWLGSKRANWEAVMGKSKWGWVLPVGHSMGDGLSYPRNPRFDSDGRWRRRHEWPEGLR